MKETVIQKQLEKRFPNSDLDFQVVYQVPYLKVAINYYSTLSFDRATLMERIQETLSELNLPDEVQYLALYIRPINQTEPDWSTCVRLITPQDSQNEISESNKAVTAKKKVSSTSESISNEQSKNSHDLKIAEQESSLVENKKLSDYCFIRNKSLLNEDIVPPPAPVAELVTSFHWLLELEKQELLPLMSQFLEQQYPEGIEEVSAQQWVEQLFNLNQRHLRKARIWLSRYCYNPEETIATLENVINQSKEPVSQEKTEYYLTQKPKNIKINETDDNIILIRRWQNLKTYLITLFTVVLSFGIFYWQSSGFLSQFHNSLALFVLLIGYVYLIYWTLAKWINRTYIFADYETILIRHKPLPWKRDGKQFRVREVALFHIENNGISYAICANTYACSDEELVIVNHKKEALFIVNTLKDYLNIGTISEPKTFVHHDGGDSIDDASDGGGVDDGGDDGDDDGGDDCGDDGGDDGDC